MLGKLTLVLLIITLVQARQGFGPGDQDWGYVEVRPHAQMFWWLHYTTASDNPTSRPLLLWFQGGPGGSASGEGNILMSGLVDKNETLRDFSYVHLANVLYIDSPVGAGYSYVDTDKGGTFVTTITEMADDLIVLLKEFLVQYPQFEDVPLYLLGESMGGKFAPVAGRRIIEEVNEGKLKANLQGVGMAYPAAQLLNNIDTMAHALLATSIVDADGFREVDSKAFQIRQEIYEGNLFEAGQLLDKLLDYVMVTYNLDFFRVTTNNIDPLGLNLEELNEFMDETVSPLLNITTAFGVQRQLLSDAVIDKLNSTVADVQYLLDNTDVKVVVYNGQLDWVVNSVGTYSWVQNMKWKSAKEFNASPRKAFYWDGIHEGHVREYENFSFYWIKRAGHQLPNDNPNAMKFILKQLIGY